jgi:hypothetical protein
LLKLFAIAFLFSVAGSAGIAYSAELLDNRIYGRAMLASLTGQQPLAVIPCIEGSPATKGRASSSHQFPEHRKRAA